MNQIFVTLGTLFFASISMAEPFTVATWNIQRGSNWKEIRKEMRTKGVGKSDIVTFQEIKERNGEQQSKLLAEEFGYPYYFQEATNSILSRFPIREAGTFKVEPDRGRRATWADIELPSGELIRVYSPHFTYKRDSNPFIPKVRARQMENTIKHADASNLPVIIAGDLNTLELWFGDGKTEQIRIAKRAGFKDALKKVLKWPKHSTQHIAGKIDWILTRGFKNIKGKRGGYGGSDHRWLRATVELAEQD